MKFPKLKNKKVMIILFFVGILLLYLLYRKWKKNKITEKFEERDICISDKNDIRQFLQDLSWNENPDHIKDLFKFPVNKQINDTLFGEPLILEKYFYDFINLQSLESYDSNQEDINYFPLSPTGVIFDTQNDDIIIFDIFRLRRFQYRLNRNDFTNKNLTKENFSIKNNFNEKEQIGKPKNIEVLSTFENNRNLFFIYLLIYVIETSDPNKERVENLSYKINNPNPNPKLNYLVLEDSFAELGKSTDEELLAIYENIDFQKDNTNKIKVKFDDLKDIVDVDIIEKVTGQEGKLNMTVPELVTEIKKLKNELDKYYEFKKCRNNTLLGNDDDRKNICKIKYQDDLPKYNLGEQGKGIESLNYDLADPNGEEIDTNYRKRAPLFNNKINPMSNSWNEPQYNGKFQPILSFRDKRTLITKEQQHSDAITNKDDNEKFKNEGMEGLNLKFDTNTNMLKETFTNYEPNSVTVSIRDGIKGYFIIPDELDSVGVKMCIEEEKRIIFVPDTMNNRIQVFDIRKGGDFDYNNQFGNLDFTTYRSLPTYQGEEVTEGNIPLKNTYVMYEPIHNTEIFGEHLLSESPARCETICKYDNEGIYNGPKNLFKQGEEPVNRSECYAELKKRLQSEGPQVLRHTEKSTRSHNIDEYYNDESRKKLELNEKYNYSGCETNFSDRRVNFHNKQIEEGKQNYKYIKEGEYYDLGEKNRKYIKKGHFYSLQNEYERVKIYLKKNDLKVASYLNEYNLVDGAEVCIGKFDTNNCNKAQDPYDGVKECSVAYRKFLLKNIYETNNGQKYGQLFRPKSITFDKNSRCFYVVDSYHHCVQCFTYNKETKKYESKDKKLNDREYFCYDKDWNYNLDYHTSPVYSLGLRQQVIQKSNFERKEDIDRQKGEFPNPDGLKGDFSTPESKISDEWCEKYSERSGEVKLYRWVSGSTKYGNKSFETKKPDYGSIGREENQERINHDYFFYTNLVVKNKKQTTNEKEAIDFPGVGEFLYPSDVIFIDRYYSAINVDLLMVADTGNNRVSIFKKYNLSKSSDDHRFRFYRFLGDNNKDNMLENPIGITFSKVNGYVYVLEGNMFNYNNNYQNYQKIKIFRPKKNKEEVEYDYYKTIDLNDIDEGKRQKDIRITKIEVDDRGFILLTDINNNKVHILKEQIEDSLEFDKSDSRVLNKVKFTLVDRQKTNVNDGIKDIRSYNRFRILVHRWNISKQEDNILMSKEFVYDYFKNKDKEAKDEFFTFEDKYEEDLYRDGYWEMNKEYGEPYIIDAQKLKGLIKKTPDKSLPIKDIQNLEVKKRIGNKENVNYGLEDWKGKPLKPNSSYFYQLYKFNYTNLEEISSENFEPVVHIPPLGIPSDKILFQNNVSNNQNTIKIDVDYDSISKLHKETSKYNPLCLYILRRNHNRTRQGLLRYLNLYRNNMIQLFVPIKSKYIFNIHSKPKFGKLYILNLNEEGDPLEMRNDKDKYLLEPTGEDKLKYMDSNFIIFYSAEGGNLDQNGYILPTSEQLGMDTIDDFFTLGDDPNDPHTKIKYHVKIDISQTRDNAIILDDNTKIENMLLHYRKDRMKRDETQLELVMKEPIAKKINRIFRNSIVRYNDSGIVKDGEKIPLPLNRTIEYNILVGNPHKLNPCCNSKFFTTRPEKPYIKDISLVTVTQGNEKKSKIKIEWYYTQNMNLYWPVNFLILRIPKADSGPGIKPYKLVLDYTKGSKNSSDINFTIQKNLVFVKTGGKHTFEKSYDLNGNKKYKVTFPKFDNLENPKEKELTINGEKFEWSTENMYHIFEGERINLKVEINGNENEYLGQAVVEEYTDENDNNLEITPGPEISNPETVNTHELQKLRNEQLENYKKEQSEQFNQNLIRAVEAYRQANRIGFYFNLQDDYNGRYRSVTDNYSGKSGQLYYYLNSLDTQQLYNILNELHDKIKIYHGEATMGIDGPNGMLRSGGKDTIIEKIRHLSFELRQATLMENKALGITCQNRDLNDIIQEEGLQGSIKCMQNEMADENDLIDKLNVKLENEVNLDIVKLVDEYNITVQPEIKRKSSASVLFSYDNLNDLLRQFKDLDSQVLLVDIRNKKKIFSNIPVEIADKDVKKENLILFEKKVEGFTGKYNIENFSSDRSKIYLLYSDNTELVKKTENPVTFNTDGSVNYNDMKNNKYHISFPFDYVTKTFSFKHNDRNTLSKIYFIFHNDGGDRDVEFFYIKLNDKIISGSNLIFKHLNKYPNGSKSDKGYREKKLYWGGLYEVYLNLLLKKGDNKLEIKAMNDNNDGSVEVSFWLELTDNYYYKISKKVLLEPQIPKLRMGIDIDSPKEFWRCTEECNKVPKCISNTDSNCCNAVSFDKDNNNCKLIKHFSENDIGNVDKTSVNWDFHIKMANIYERTSTHKDLIINELLVQNNDDRQQWMKDANIIKWDYFSDSSYESISDPQTEINFKIKHTSIENSYALKYIVFRILYNYQTIYNLKKDNIKIRLNGDDKKLSIKRIIKYDYLNNSTEILYDFNFKELKNKSLYYIEIDDYIFFEKDKDYEFIIDNIVIEKHARHLLSLKFMKFNLDYLMRSNSCLIDNTKFNTYEMKTYNTNKGTVYNIDSICDLIYPINTENLEIIRSGLLVYDYKNKNYKLINKKDLREPMEFVEDKSSFIFEPNYSAKDLFKHKSFQDLEKISITNDGREFITIGNNDYYIQYNKSLNSGTSATVNNSEYQNIFDDTNNMISYNIFDSTSIKSKIDIKSEKDITDNIKSDINSIFFIKITNKEAISNIGKDIEVLEENIGKIDMNLLEKIKNKEEKINILKEEEENTQELLELLKEIKTLYEKNNISNEIKNKINNLEEQIIKLIRDNLPELTQYFSVNKNSNNINKFNIEKLELLIELKEKKILIKKQKIIDNYNLQEFTGKYVIEGFEDLNNVPIQEIINEINSIKSNLENLESEPVEQIEIPEIIDNNDLISTSEKEKKDFLENIVTNKEEKFVKSISDKIDIENDLSIIDSSSKEIQTTDYQLYIERFVNDEMEGIRNLIIDTVNEKVIFVKKIITIGEKNNIEKIGSTCIWKKGEKRYFARKVKNYQILNGNLTKPVLQIENNKLSESNNKTILENYAIQPTLSSLAAEKNISADKLFNDDTKDKNHMYTLHTHYIDLDTKDKKEYGYKIGCYQVGHNLNNTQKRKFLGIVRNSPESELGYGEVYSDMRFLGQGGELEQENNEPISFLSEIPKQAEEVVEPVIKYFEPKEGNQHTVVRIVGNGLDKLEYICFRDVKVKILKKQKRIIVENGEKVSYQEYIVKPPTLKELDRECWQSYEPYKVLVWGYFKGTGKQIRSSETQNPESKMYKYMDRSNCPESNKAMRKYKKDIVPSMSN